MASADGSSVRNTELQLVSFRLGGEEYAVDILDVQEIIRMTEITRLPNAPVYIEGIVNLRGVVIPILDLRLRFGMENTEPTVQSRIIVVRLEALVVGLVVDQVMEVLRINSDAVDTAPELVTERTDADFIRGVGKREERLLILLDLESVLTNDIRAGIGTMTGTESGRTG